MEIEALGWGEDAVIAFHAFFYKLDLHKIRRREDGGLILAQYQADICKQWHDHLDQKEEVFDVSIVNLAVMLQSEKTVLNRQRI